LFPVLQVGPLAIQTYPLTLMVAGWVALALGAQVATRLGLDGDHIYNAGLLALLAGLVGGRVGHVVAYWSAYQTQPAAVVALNPRAILLWPAIAAGMVAAGWYMARHRLPWAAAADAAGAGALAGYIVANLGALLAGEGLGAPTAVPWAVTVWGTPRHPVQLYAAALGLVALAGVWWALRHAARPGAVAWLAVLAVGTSTWLLDPFRAEAALVLGGLRSAQLAGLAAMLLALWALRPRRRPLNPAPDTPQVEGQGAGLPAVPETPAGPP
jgi:phosphatidylglycerol:prolipoprotein diacylglycerol transferase